MNEIPVASSRRSLADNLKLTWKEIPRETINNPISGTPKRVQARVGERDGYIGK